MLRKQENNLNCVIVLYIFSWLDIKNAHRKLFLLDPRKKTSHAWLVQTGSLSTWQL